MHPRSPLTRSRPFFAPAVGKEAQSPLVFNPRSRLNLRPAVAQNPQSPCTTDTRSPPAPEVALPAVALIPGRAVAPPVVAHLSFPRHCGLSTSVWTACHVGQIFLLRGKIFYPRATGRDGVATCCLVRHATSDVTRDAETQKYV